MTVKTAVAPIRQFCDNGAEFHKRPRTRRPRRVFNAPTAPPIRLHVARRPGGIHIRVVRASRSLDPLPGTADNHGLEDAGDLPGRRPLYRPGQGDRSGAIPGGPGADPLQYLSSHFVVSASTWPVVGNGRRGLGRGDLQLHGPAAVWLDTPGLQPPGGDRRLHPVRDPLGTDPLERRDHSRFDLLVPAGLSLYLLLAGRDRVALGLVSGRGDGDRLGLPDAVRRPGAVRSAGGLVVVAGREGKASRRRLVAAGWFVRVFIRLC